MRMLRTIIIIILALCFISAKIYLAGYGISRIDSNHLINLITIWCFAYERYHDIDNVELYYEGVPTGNKMVRGFKVDNVVFYYIHGEYIAFKPNKINCELRLMTHGYAASSWPFLEVK